MPAILVGPDILNSSKNYFSRHNFDDSPVHDWVFMVPKRKGNSISGDGAYIKILSVKEEGHFKRNEDFRSAEYLSSLVIVGQLQIEGQLSNVTKGKVGEHVEDDNFKSERDQEICIPKPKSNKNASVTMEDDPKTDHPRTP
ncbi:hypothetical protein V6N11_068915 [Hibiscus sabdariffa]|uniref:Uncharacterized protein n=1 Tax=Hibiscus sabdariffa TaxID=183260 RepID=A0ABR2PBH4_9ROSI